MGNSKWSKITILTKLEMACKSRENIEISAIFLSVHLRLLFALYALSEPVTLHFDSSNPNLSEP